MEFIWDYIDEADELTSCDLRYLQATQNYIDDQVAGVAKDVDALIVMADTQLRFIIVAQIVSISLVVLTIVCVWVSETLASMTPAEQNMVYRQVALTERFPLALPALNENEV